MSSINGGPRAGHHETEDRSLHHGSAAAVVPPVVEIIGLDKSFPGVRALRSASLEIRPGEVHGLVGENGAGKSTMIKILAGAQKRDEGIIRVDGVAVQLASEREADELGLHFVHQDVALVARQTVAENLFLGRSLPRRGPWVSQQKMNDVARGWLEDFADIDPEAKVGSLSVAARSMLAIARACAGDARLVVMDEPTVALADAEVELVYRAVERLRQRGIAVLFVSHRLGEILQLSQRVTVMKDGCTVASHDIEALDRRSLIGHIIGREAGELPSVDVNRQRSDVKVLTVEGLTGGPVNDLSFEVHEGEILGIGGLVGSGRTSVLLQLFGQHRPESGTITLDGKILAPRAPSDAIGRGVALIPEDRRGQGLIPKRTVRENIVLTHLRDFRALEWLPWPSRGREDARTTIEISNLQIACTGGDQTIATLSGGNQQKALLARWLVGSNIRLLMLDEPTKGVDVGARDEILRVIARLAETGVAVILVSSDLEEVAAISHRVMVLREGTKVADLPGPVTESEILAHCYAHDGETTSR